MPSRGRPSVTMRAGSRIDPVLSQPADLRRPRPERRRPRTGRQRRRFAQPQPRDRERGLAARVRSGHPTSPGPQRSGSGNEPRQLRHPAGRSRQELSFDPPAGLDGQERADDLDDPVHPVRVGAVVRFLLREVSKSHLLLPLLNLPPSSRLSAPSVSLRAPVVVHLAAVLLRPDELPVVLSLRLFAAARPPSAPRSSYSSPSRSSSSSSSRARSSYSSPSRSSSSSGRSYRRAEVVEFVLRPLL